MFVCRWQSIERGFVHARATIDANCPINEAWISHAVRLRDRYRKRRGCERSVNAFSLSQGVQQRLSGKARTSRRPCKAAAPKHPHLHQHPPTHTHTHTHIHIRASSCLLVLRARTFIHVYALIFLPSMHLRPKYLYPSRLARFAHLMILRRIVFSIPRRDSLKNRAEEIGIPRSWFSRFFLRSLSLFLFSFFLLVSIRRFEELRERIFLRRGWPGVNLRFATKVILKIVSWTSVFVFHFTGRDSRNFVRFVEMDFALEFSADDKCGINWKLRRKCWGRLIRD